MKRITILDRIEFSNDQTLQVRFIKRTLLDEEVLKDEFHRTAIPPGVDVDAQMAMVNAHLARMKFEPVSDDAIAAIRSAAAAVHSAAVVEAYIAGMERAAEGENPSGLIGGLPPLSVGR